MYDNFAVFVTNDWLREFFVSRRASNRVQDGCMHASSSFDATDSTGKYALERPADLRHRLFPSQGFLLGATAQSH
jgi:hypothetical protein